MPPIEPGVEKPCAAGVGRVGGKIARAQEFSADEIARQGHVPNLVKQGGVILFDMKQRGSQVAAGQGGDPEVVEFRACQEIHHRCDGRSVAVFRQPHITARVLPVDDRLDDLAPGVVQNGAVHLAREANAADGSGVNPGHGFADGGCGRLPEHRGRLQGGIVVALHGEGNQPEVTQIQDRNLDARRAHIYAQRIVCHCSVPFLSS